MCFLAVLSNEPYDRTRALQVSVRRRWALGLQRYLVPPNSPPLSCIKHLPQVYVLGCAGSTVFHLQLDETTGEVASTANYTADSGITGSQSGGVFVAIAFELAVLVGRPDSDEVGWILQTVGNIVLLGLIDCARRNARGLGNHAVRPCSYPR